jgi:L-threonylcarbamoyladenylate synthase
MNILTIDQAIELLLENKIIAVPTETVYGLFGLANSTESVQNVYDIKNRPSDNPLICHFYSLEQILEYVETPPEYICKLIELIGPGPLTYVLKLKPNSTLAPACAGLPTICCRIPHNTKTLKLLQKINVPLFGPSANTSSKVSGVTVEMIDQDLGNKIAGMIDGGQSIVGLESTIINTLEVGIIKILRPGVIGKIELEAYLDQIGCCGIKVVENEKSESVTPGTKYRHYSPRTKIYLEKKIPLVEGGQAKPDGVDTVQLKNKIGLKEFQLQKMNYISLGSKDDLAKVSANFYLNLYELDQLKLENCIFDRQSYEIIRDSQLSVVKALFNRLAKVLSIA